MSPAFVEFKFQAQGFETGNLQEYIKSVCPSEILSMMYTTPLVRQDGDCFVVGFGFYVDINPEMSTVPDDIVPILSKAGQHIHWKAEIGSSLTDVYESSDPMAKEIMKGIRLTHKHCLISNLKKVFLDMSQSEATEENVEEAKLFAEKRNKAMDFAPATLMTVSGNLDLEF